MSTPTLHARAIWVSEHYWPGVADELVLAQAQRLAGVEGCVRAIVLSGQETVIGLYEAGTAAEVQGRLAAVGLATEVVQPGWSLDPSTTLETSS